MGRLPKSKVDKVIEMIRDQYTIKETAEKVGCSESTVSRIKKRLETVQEGDSEMDLPVVMVKTLYRMLEIMELSFTLKGETVDLFVRPLAKEFTEHLMRIDPTLAKRALEESGFYEYCIKPILIEKEDQALRREWIDFLKRYYPERLAELII
jgi:hypothetical protein